MTRSIGSGQALSDTALRLIQDCEGCVLRPYRDTVGVWTDGYGNTYGVVPGGPPIGQAKADADLMRNLAGAEADVARLVKVALTQGQFDALVSFTFNLGAGALGGSTLLRRLNAGDAAGAAAEFGKWVHAGGEVLPGLVTRRAKERALFEGDA
jgi:lysozyme